MEQARLEERLTDIALSWMKAQTEKWVELFAFLVSGKCNITDIMGKIIHIPSKILHPNLVRKQKLHEKKILNIV